jgi:hypothetical protein
MIKSNPAAVARDRLKIDTMKFIMGRIAPAIYGDQPALGIEGPVSIPQVKVFAQSAPPTIDADYERIID